MKRIRSGLLALIVGAALAIPAGTQAAGADKFIPTFLVYYGGGPQLVSADAAKLAKFDLIDIDRFRYQDIGPNTWAAIKALNPAIQIYLYEMGPEAPSHLDGTLPLFLNGMGRYNVSRGHFMGSLNGNHPELYLLNGAGQRVYSVGFSNVGANQYWHLMDFGDSNYQSYWVTAVKADIVDQPWVADGVFVDNCISLPSAGGYSATSARYPTDTAWSAAMNTFVDAISNGMHGYGQKLWCNRAESRSIVGSAAWLSLDNGANPPDVVLDEGAFAVEWGADTQFYPEQEWKRQIDTIAAIRNSKVATMSHTKLMDGQSGTDNWGRPVGFAQTLWYALGSFLLAKNDALGNAHFMFSSGTGYNRIWWFDEYDLIDLGNAVGGYRVTPVGGVNIYWREFERGYVYVNPTASNVASIVLPQASRLMSRATLGALPDALPLVSSIALNGHHAAFLLKTDVTLPPPPLPDIIAPSVPAGLSASVISASQVNLSWNASTDNVGVTGYYVYLNDAPLATTTATSFSHTGLTGGTTYRYRVSAFDAVPNHSAWTATPVSATTSPASDATAPSVPAGLTATAVSATRVNLTWSASTDNVSVVGYHVYLNDASIATTTTTTFSHTGLTAGTTYSYRVSAYDAVPNHSAWTAAPVAVQTPAATAAKAKLRRDINGDGKSDILWRNQGTGGTGQNYLYPMNGTAILATEGYVRTVSLTSGWQIAGVGDFNGDGKVDILWRNALTGENYLYFMNGTTILPTEGYIRTLADQDWQVAGIGDFDGDGKDDILWRNASSGQNYLYPMDGLAIKPSEGYLRTVADTAWRVAGIGDFDGDGKDDILWRNSNAGQNYVYFMNGTTILPTEGYIRTVVDQNWQVAGIGDFDGDGKDDILWRNSSSGQNYLYPMDRLAIKPSEGYLRTVADTAWQVKSVADFDGDGKADIVWRNATSGQNYLYPMDGAAIKPSEGYLRTVPVGNWDVVSR